MDVVIHMAENENWAWVGESPKGVNGKNVGGATSCGVGDGGGCEANAGIPASGTESKGGIVPEMGA